MVPPKIILVRLSDNADSYGSIISSAGVVESFGKMSKIGGKSKRRP
jgi:hypothetical protein